MEKIFRKKERRKVLAHRSKVKIIQRGKKKKKKPFCQGGMFREKSSFRPPTSLMALENKGVTEWWEKPWNFSFGFYDHD